MKGSDPGGGDWRVLSVITNNANTGLDRRDQAHQGSPGLNGNDCKVNSKFAQPDWRGNYVGLSFSNWITSADIPYNKMSFNPQ